MAGVSGSAVADASAVSSVLLPTMKEQGYDRPFAASINAAAAVIGPIIPPSIPMIFIGVISGLSIGRLFLGGVIPGLIMGLFLAVTVAVFTRKKNYPVTKTQQNLRGFLALLRDTSFALSAPLIIILGVVLGIVTLVEVSVLANFYILIISLFIYRSIRFKDILRIFSKAAVFSTSIMIIFAVVGLYQYIVASEQLAEKLGLLVASMNLNQFTFLLLAYVFFLFMGCILDAVPVMLIFFPVLLPAATKLGVDPTHFGVIVVINLMIGLLTPPIGALLFLEAKIADLEFDVLIRHIWPYTLALIIVLYLCTYIPQLVLYIPNLIL
jgi:tripartite ATP-independent transporter DctM subunit